MDGNAPSTEETTKYPRMAFANARVWPDNPRKTIKGIDELAASISRNDIIEPLVVRALPAPEGDVTHEVLAGQRRYLAGQKAGLIDFPYILRQLDDAEALEIALVENNQREDSSPLEDAEALHKRMTDAKNPCTAEYLADRLGRPVKWVYGRLALRALCDEAKEWMRNGKLPLAHAQQLAAVDVDTQRRVLDRFKGAPELPAAKAFAHEITYALHLLSGAPFDCNDAKLPGGSCLKCTKRSDVQVELFDTGRDKGAHCLDNICWTNKVAAIWERAQRDAKKRHLEVLTDRDVVRDGYSEDRAHVEWGKPYDLKPQKEGDVPVAVARTPRGVVVELYAKTVKQGAGDDGGDDEFFEDEGDEDSDDANTERHAARDAERAAREAEHQGVATRVLALVRERHPAFARLALEIVEGSVYADRALPRLMRAVGVDPEPSGSDTRALVRLVPDADVVDVLITYAVLGCLTDPEPSDEAPEWEVRVRELVTGKPVVVPTTRVWIRAAEWDGLSDDTRENYEHGVDGREIGWEGREGFVTATVGNETLGYLQRISRSYKVTLHAEIEQPDPETQATEAPADEAPVVAPNLYSYGFAPGCPDEIKAEVQEIVGAPLVFLSTGMHENYFWTPAYDEGSEAHTKIAALIEALPLDERVHLRNGYIETHELTPTEKGTFRGCCHRRCKRLRLQRVEIGPGLYCTACRAVIEGKAPQKASGPAEPPPEEAPVPSDEPDKPRAGELVFFRGEDNGCAIESITATHLIVQVNGMSFEVPRATILWAGRWQTPVSRPETTTLRVTNEVWQKHKSGLQDTSTGALHKRWVLDGDNRVVTFVSGTGNYDKIRACAQKHKIELFCGDRRVSPEEETFSAAKKRSKKVEQPDAEGPSTPARERVLVVSDSGDWAGARRGLKAWDAVKTPGAGATSGGDCAPLVMLHTPATDSPDIATLLARYVKARRHVLDLGVIDRDALAAHDPSKLAIRERWNEAHPDAKVPIDREKHSS